MAHFDRVHWTVVPDAATAAAALRRGEVDWWEQPLPDLLPMLRADPAVQVQLVEVTGNVGLLRFNQLHPPFNDSRVRRAVLQAMRQADFMAVVAGADRVADRNAGREAWRDRVGFFAPGTPAASEAGLDALDEPHDASAARAAVRAALASAGPGAARTVLLAPGDYPRILALCEVAADLLRRCGLEVDMQVMDGGTMGARRASRAPVDKGGWSAFITAFAGVDMASPASHLALRGTGDAAWFGWPVAPELERLRDDWLAAEDEEQQHALAAAIQTQAFVDVPFLPLGQFFQSSAHRRSLAGVLEGMPLFWNVRRG